jgi:hypothetical protein
MGPAKIYVAAPLARFMKAKSIAGRLTTAGHVITSHWHDEVRRTDVDPLDLIERENLLMRNFAELQDADFVVAYLAAGEPRTTFGEIGFAYALDKPVVMALPPGQSPNRCLLDAHPLARVYTSDELLEETVTKLVADMGLGGPATELAVADGETGKALLSADPTRCSLCGAPAPRLKGWRPMPPPDPDLGFWTYSCGKHNELGPWKPHDPEAR